MDHFLQKAKAYHRQRRSNARFSIFSLLHYFNLRGRGGLPWIHIQMVSVAVGFKEHVRFG